MQFLAQATYAQQLAEHQAGLGTDSMVRTAVLKTISALLPEVTNKPTGTPVDPVESDVSAKKDALSAIQKVYGAQSAGSISITFCGEDHSDERDKQRAMSLIAAMGADTVVPTLVVFERGMKYPVNGIVCPIAREENMTTIAAGDFGLWTDCKTAQHGHSRIPCFVSGWRRSEYH